MSRKRNINVEHQVLDPLEDRVATQEITYLAQDGRPITNRKIDYLDRAQTMIMGVIAEGVGLDVVHVSTKRG